MLLLKVAKIEKAFPLWTAREMRWRRNIADRASKFAAVILRPSSRTSSNPFSPHAPDVSIAIGTKSIPAGKSEYLVIFFSSAIFAAEPAEILEAWMCEIAKVSGQVASHARHRPFFQGTVVTPSGRFPVTPALVHSPVGSRVLLNINTHRAHPFFTTLTAHGGIFLPPDGKSIISRTP